MHRRLVAPSFFLALLPWLGPPAAAATAPVPCPAGAAARASGALRTVLLEGVVSDPDGAPVRGARVAVTAAGGRCQTRTGPEGRFAIALELPAEGALAAAPPAASAAPFPIEVRAEADGFQPRTSRWLPEDAPGGAAAGPLRIVLPFTAWSEELVVTPTRTETAAAATAADVTVLNAAELAATAVPAIDAMLRLAPGFSLFRRQDSRYANPTAQGVSLRGVGASGASRALVLDDGVPLNDPFGGWIYWARLPRAALERAEVVQGGGSELYGTGAVGGVVDLVRKRSDRTGAALDASYGSLATADGSAFLAGAAAPWSAGLAAEGFRTDGYVAADPRQRGPVDTAVASRHAASDLTLHRATGEASDLFARGSYFEESRDNGTPLQVNRSHVWQGVVGGDLALGDSSLSWRGRGGSQQLHQTFSAISLDRRRETLTDVQDVPVDSGGLDAQWSALLAAAHTLVAGLDLGEVRGESDERFPGGAGSRRVAAGGRQENAAAFAEDQVALGERTKLTAALRLDRFWNRDGRSVTELPGGAAATVTRFAPRGETALSPRLSLVRSLSPELTARASAYRAFRSPTLNELYRDFRVGNVLTLANAGLRAEHATGGELGDTWSGRLSSLAGTAFYVSVRDPISNATLAATPALITRRRENLGSTRSAGFDLLSELRLGSRLRLAASCLVASSIVTRAPADRSLEGRWVPQVPRLQATLELRYADPAIGSFGIQTRYVGRQFDDDQNRLPLRSFVTADALASHALSDAMAVFVAAENLFGAREEISRTPIFTLGPPRSFRAGLRGSW
jgi:outer membrane receptor protein involved in Fe transport